MNTKIEIKHIILLLILSTTWGANYIFVKIAVNSLAPLIVMSIRGLSASLFLIIAMIVMKKPFWRYLTHVKMQSTCIVAAILIAYMWFTMAKAETILPASMTSLLLATLPIFAWLISTFIYREKPFYWVNLAGIIIGTIGLIVMIGLHNLSADKIQLWYALLYITGLCAFAISAAISSHSCRHIDSFILVTLSTIYITIFLCLFTFTHIPLQQIHYSWSGILAACGTGIISTGIGYLIYFWLIAHAGQMFPASNGYLVPIAGFIMGVVLLGETGYLHQIVGLLIVFVGTYFINKSTKKSANYLL